MVGLEAFYSADRQWLGKSDIEWLSEVGRNGWLALSCNKRMLMVPAERQVIVAEKVGIVFLTSGQERLPDTLRLLLDKWPWLETIDRSVQRPFAYYLYPSGRTRKVL